MSYTAIPMRWDGEALTPVSQRWAKEADRQYVIGEVYRIEAVEDRSMRSHSHFFAVINEAWMNLPEDKAEAFPTPDHLRRYALIKANYCDTRTIACSSRAEAHKVAAFIKPMDTFALVVPFDDTVTVWTAKSQSLKAMGRKDFQKSKTAVLDIISSMIGVSSRELEKSAA